MTNENWRRLPAEGTRFPWPWTGKAADEVADVQIAAYLRCCHLDYPVSANREELLTALRQAGYEVPA